MFNVGIYIYPNAEVLDFSGPFEVFSTASRVSAFPRLFNTFLISETSVPVEARGGFSVNPQHSITNHPTIDVLVIAGGVHHDQLVNVEVLNWIQKIAPQAQIVSSVCTGVFLLAEAGLLKGLKVTTHWEDMDELERDFPDMTIVRNKRWVEQGKYVTSGGITAGIDMSLHLVERIIDHDLAKKTAKQMDYVWSNASNYYIEMS